MRDRIMRSGTELAREMKLTDWSMAGNLSNRSSGVQIPRDILRCYLTKKCGDVHGKFDFLENTRFKTFEHLLKAFLSYFFVKKIPLSRRVGYVMGSSASGSVSGSVRGECMSHQSDWIYY